MTEKVFISDTELQNMSYAVIEEPKLSNDFYKYLIHLFIIPQPSPVLSEGTNRGVSAVRDLRGGDDFLNFHSVTSNSRTRV